MNNIYFLVRHGESLLNSMQCHQGWRARNPLTTKGIKQVSESGKSLVGKEIEVVYSSPLLRTKKSAEIISRVINCSVLFSHKLKDYRRSKKQEGLHVSKYSTMADYLLWKEVVETDRAFSLPDGESKADFAKRVKNFAMSIDRKYDGKKILVVTHKDVVWHLISHWTNEEINKNDIDNARIYKVEPVLRKLIRF